MAIIFPFRGTKYNKDKVENLTDVVSQPYDKITPEMQKKYYTKHPYNIVRIIKGEEMPNEKENNKYTRAGRYLNEWLMREVLIDDLSPAIYVYHQIFDAEGRTITRKGFIALGKLEATGKGVKAHEKTLEGPKADRLNLMRATRANFGHIFMLYSDPQEQIDAILDSAIGERAPDMEAKDYFGETHRVWTITDKNVIDEIRSLMSAKTLFIADGHHRYETAVNYMMECRQKGLTPAPGATETFENRMMTFVNMDSPGLVVLPTHRVVHSVEGFDAASFLQSANNEFAVREFDNRDTAIAALESDRGRVHSFLFVPRGVEKFYLLTLKDESVMDTAISEALSPDWKRLDVNILHKLLLENLLGIDQKALAEQRNVAYARGYDAGFERLESDPSVQMVFFMNPTGVQEVKRLATNGERMPQKSTDFYPKLLTGLVLSRMRFGV